MKILVVDDHPLIVEDIIDELKEIAPKAECTGLSDPTEVMPCFREHRHEVVMLDIDMPGINGLTLAKSILEIQPKTNIIYITGHEKYALESYSTYASDFLVKPVSTKRLQNAMNNLRFPVSEITEEMIVSHYSGSAVIGARIRMYRERSGISRGDFAERMNVSLQSVYRWESGERVPDVLTLMEIARILGVGMDQITGTKT
ncbi:MAG: response regulator [Lachnospiraceae bacterium]|nr:response regulator [Lachnospiraceae bacterium]